MSNEGMEVSIVSTSAQTKPEPVGDEARQNPIVDRLLPSHAAHVDDGPKHEESAPGRDALRGAASPRRR